MSFQGPKGANDILPGGSEKWRFVEETARLLLRDCQYSKMRTPIFEHYEVISRSVEGTMGIVSKEMYDFYDKGERHVTLRPGSTAPIVRSFVEHKLLSPECTRPFEAFYMGPMFRYERPQKGRLYQFHQVGVEAFGPENPTTDVESMVMVLDFFKQLGITQVQLVINSLGDKEMRQAYRQALIDYLLPLESELSEDSKRRLHENPLHALGSRNRRDQKFMTEAPSILDYLSEPAQKHFDTVVSMLDALAVPYEIDSNMVHGLDYYTHTIFEIMSDTPKMRAQATIYADGRYDNLVEELGGSSTPGFGFTIDIERLLLTMEAEEIVVLAFNELDAYVVTPGNEANIEALRVVQAVRNFDFSADHGFMNRKIEAQFKTADKASAKLVLMTGEDKPTSQTINIKTMASREEKGFPLEEIYEHFDEVHDKIALFE